MQRRHWALEVLRKDGVRSVMDIGCGPGSLLQTLVMPASTIPEKPIRGQDGSIPDGKELFIRVSILPTFHSCRQTLRLRVGKEPVVVGRRVHWSLRLKHRDTRSEREGRVVWGALRKTRHSKRYSQCQMSASRRQCRCPKDGGRRQTTGYTGLPKAGQIALEPLLHPCPHTSIVFAIMNVADGSAWSAWTLTPRL